STGWAEFSAGGGTLAYFSYTPTLLQWFDRAGGRGASALPPGLYEAYSIAPDGNRVSFSIQETISGRSDLWLLELKGHGVTRITDDSADNGTSVWPPDGRRLAFFSFQGHGKTTLSVRDLSTGADEHPLEPGFQAPTDWSDDGEYLALMELDPNDPLNGMDIW